MNVFLLLNPQNIVRKWITPSEAAISNFKSLNVGRQAGSCQTVDASETEVETKLDLLDAPETCYMRSTLSLEIAPW